MNKSFDWTCVVMMSWSKSAESLWSFWTTASSGNILVFACFHVNFRDCTISEYGRDWIRLLNRHWYENVGDMRCKKKTLRNHLTLQSTVWARDTPLCVNVGIFKDQGLCCFAQFPSEQQSDGVQKWKHIADVLSLNVLSFSRPIYSSCTMINSKNTSSVSNVENWCSKTGDYLHRLFLLALGTHLKNTQINDS